MFRKKYFKYGWGKGGGRRRLKDKSISSCEQRRSIILFDLCIPVFSSFLRFFSTG